jgi:hypothetical protein
MAGRRNWLPRCGALTRRGSHCLMKPVINPNGSIRNGRCRLHAGLSTGPRTPEGHHRCLEGRQKLYDQRKAAGLPAINRKPKVASAAIPERPRLSPESDAARRERIFADLARRYPDRDWS